MTALRPIRLRPIITVSGFCSGVGKTSLAEFLIRRFKPMAALKVTVVDSGVAGCPIDRACGVCEALRVPYRIITERRRIDVPHKDTGRYAAAGAAPVVWVQTHGECLDEALAAGLAIAGGSSASGSSARGLVVEGNTPVPRLAPDVAIMVDRPGRRETKPSAAAILERIHIAVLNRPAADGEGALVAEAELAGAAELAAARAVLARDLPRAEVFEMDVRAPGAAGERLVASLGRRIAAVQGWPEGALLE